MKKILVTGGLGYIGSHTVVELIEHGFEVVIIDDLSNSKKQVLYNIEKITGVLPELYQGDIKCRQVLKLIFTQHVFDGVIHFAAFKSVSESQTNPLEYYDNNINGLVTLLYMMKQFKVQNLIFSSSCTVYGQANKMPIKESTPLKLCESSYGKTKQMGEQIIEDFVKAYNKKACLLRYFNPIGAHKSGLLGELPNGVPNNLVPFVLQTAIGIRECLNIWGDDYPTDDGTAVRDYIYVGDLALAHLAALLKLLKEDRTSLLDIYNLGTGRGTSVLEIVKTFEKVTKQKVNYIIGPRRQGDITIAYADASLAEKELNWKATTGIEQSLLTAWQWQLNLNEYLH
ncbi:UDP-glucose 4-epimerase GalE [Myroides injenensis]|uniref:UDP-glucose 4-epimerase GalE n=1 Tax=Myroides injenensis TaxID=1183151 RepID=UPI00226DF29C|nr:UDP-glucose 4-epimerase GalE [Myroides injenensis]